MLHQINTTQTRYARDKSVKLHWELGNGVVRTSTIVMIAFAVVFGLLAVFIAQSWLNSQAEMRMKSLEANKKPIATKHDRGRRQVAALRQ